MPTCTSSVGRRSWPRDAGERLARRTICASCTMTRAKQGAAELPDESFEQHAAGKFVEARRPAGSNERDRSSGERPRRRSLPSSRAQAELKGTEL